MRDVIHGEFMNSNKIDTIAKIGIVVGMKVKRKLYKFSKIFLYILFALCSGYAFWVGFTEGIKRYKKL